METSGTIVAAGDGGADSGGALSAPTDGLQSRARSLPAFLSPLAIELILDQMADGRPVKEILGELGINPGSFYRFKRTDDFLRDEFDLARKDGLHAMADDVIKIADNSALAPEDRKVRIYARLQMMAKWQSGSYADKLQVDANVTTRNLNINVSIDPVQAASDYQDMMRDS